MWLVIFCAGVGGLAAGCGLLLVGGHEFIWFGLPITACGLALAVLGIRASHDVRMQVLGSPYQLVRPRPAPTAPAPGDQPAEPPDRFLSGEAAARLIDCLRQEVTHGGDDAGAVRLARRDTPSSDSEFQCWVMPRIYRYPVWLKMTVRVALTPDGRAELFVTLRPSRWWYPAGILLGCAVVGALALLQWGEFAAFPLEALPFVITLTAFVSWFFLWFGVLQSRQAVRTWLERTLTQC
jgi:hypothetical protein